jgi:hypothetical protein
VGDSFPVKPYFSGREGKPPEYLSRHLPTPETISRHASQCRRKGTLEVDVLFHVLKQENELFSLPTLFLSLAVHGELFVSAHFSKMGYAECLKIKL